MIGERLEVAERDVREQAIDERLEAGNVAAVGVLRRRAAAVEPELEQDGDGVSGRHKSRNGHSGRIGSRRRSGQGNGDEMGGHGELREQHKSG